MQLTAVQLGSEPLSSHAAAGNWLRARHRCRRGTVATAAGAGVGHSRAVSLMTAAGVVLLPKWHRSGWCRSERRPPPPMRTVEVQPSAVPVGVAAPIQGGDAGGGGAGGGGAGGGVGVAPSAQRIAQAAIPGQHPRSSTGELLSDFLETRGARARAQVTLRRPVHGVRRFAPRDFARASVHPVVRCHLIGGCGGRRWRTTCCAMPFSCLVPSMA